VRAFRSSARAHPSRHERQLAKLRRPVWNAAGVEPFDVHKAARRYLLDRWQELVDAYDRLDSGGRSRIGFGYTRKAYKLFPRYNVVDAIRVEVDVSTPIIFRPQASCSIAWKTLARRLSRYSPVRRSGRSNVA
jgi:hypothetical protein